MRLISGRAQHGEEPIDALEQSGSLLVELAGGGQDIIGQDARLVRSLACAGDVARDLGRAGRGLLNATRYLPRRRILLFDGCGNGGSDGADLADGIADAPIAPTQSPVALWIAVTCPAISSVAFAV